uniref:Uncharacterized protein n=1 Tax=Strigamia maritima TaxID=126957 RepID=T1IZG7_STRMM
MIKQLIVVVSVSLFITFGNGYVLLNPYITKVPPVYHIVQIAGPLQFQHPNQDTQPPSGEDTDTAASTPQLQIIPRMVLPYGYAVTGVVPFTGYVPTGTHYINTYLPTMQSPMPAGKDKNEENHREEENNGVKTVNIGPTEVEEESRRKRESQMGPIVEFSFPELRIKPPPPEEH